MIQLSIPFILLSNWKPISGGLQSNFPNFSGNFLGPFPRNLSPVERAISYCIGKTATIITFGDVMTNISGGRVCENKMEESYLPLRARAYQHTAAVRWRWRWLFCVERMLFTFSRIARGITAIIVIITIMPNTTATSPRPDDAAFTSLASCGQVQASASIRSAL